MATRRIRTAVIVLSILGAFYLLWRAGVGGSDFRVYHRTILHAWNGESPYLLSRDGIATYKYPPWTLPVFLPFVAVPLSLAPFLWGVLSVGWAWLIGVRLKRVWGVDAVSFSAAFITTYGVWLSHFILGQVILPIVCASLWLWEDRVLERSTARGTFLAWLLSFKIFPELALLYRLRVNRRSVWTIAVGMLGIGLLSVGVAVLAGDHHEVGLLEVLRRLFSGWMENLSGGNEILGHGQLYGPLNQGGPARVYGAVAGVFSFTNPQGFTVILSLILSGVLGTAAVRLFRKSPPETVWLVILALLPVAHPLAWRHLFLFSFPLVAATIHQARLSGSRGLLASSLLAGMMIGNLTRETLGPLGAFLETCGIKTLGVLLVVGLFRRSLHLREWAGSEARA